MASTGDQISTSATFDIFYASCLIAITVFLLSQISEFPVFVTLAVLVPLQYYAYNLYI